MVILVVFIGIMSQYPMFLDKDCKKYSNRHIELNIYFKDDNGNIIGSDWTNDNSIIKPNASQTISNMMSKDIKNASVEVADIIF